MRALVLISPKINFRGIAVAKLIGRPPFSNLLSIQIIVGRKKATALKDAKLFKKYFMKNRPFPDPNKPETLTVFLDTLNTSLQGSEKMKILSVKDERPVDQRIAKFIELRLSNKEGEAYDWSSRKKSNP